MKGIDMNKSEQVELGVLSKEYRVYIKGLRAGWRAKNQVKSRDVYELMSEIERSQVSYRIAKWARYITPLAEAWWRERGYRVEWPDDDSKPMKVFKVEFS